MSIVNALIGTSAAGSPFNQVLFDVPGTYSWIAPRGVTSVSVACVGGGGGGSNVGAGGGGGGAGYKNNIAVTPGQQYTVVVGAGGAGGSGVTTANPGADGGNSYFISTATVAGFGGTGGGIYSAADLSNGIVPAKSSKLFLINLYNSSLDANSNYSSTAAVSIGNQSSTFPGMQSISTYNVIAVFGSTVASRIIQSGLINTSGKTTMYLYVNKGGSGWGNLPATGQNLLVEYSLNNSTWTLITTITPASVTTNTWSAFSIGIPAGAQSSGVYFRIRQAAQTTTNNWAFTSLTFSPNAWIPQEGYRSDVADFGASGGSYVGDGGGIGGFGGLNGGSGSGQAGGGGGAGGYSGTGGSAAWSTGNAFNIPPRAAAAGSGSSAGGGGGTWGDTIQNGNVNSGGGGGGGNGLLNATAAGAAGTSNNSTSGVTGGGGVNGGANGTDGFGVTFTVGNSLYTTGKNGGLYGGGGGGIVGMGQSTFPLITGGSGANGAVRIIWNTVSAPSRSYPNNAADV